MVGVVIVDDSALIRQLLTSILSSDPEIQVLGAANDPFQARQMIKTLNPDVITLDVEMPKMDGISFLEKIMRLRPMPVVMVSSLTQTGAEITIRALEMGAVDFVGKPTIDIEDGMKAMSNNLITKVKAAARARVSAHTGASTPKPKPVTSGPGFLSTERTVAIGASTGGVEALREVISALPSDAPATLITQHMPGGFTASFSERLNAISAVTVQEAQDGERILPGHVYVAKGGMHLKLGRSGATYVCRLSDGPPISGHKPSVDVLFRSVAEAAGPNGIGVIMTGMGRDGAEGLKDMRAAGATTIGQDESTSLVYGMPRAAKAVDAIEIERPLSKIAQEIIESCRRPT